MDDNLQLIMEFLNEIYILDYSVNNFILHSGKQPIMSILMAITGTEIPGISPGSITDTFTPYSLCNLAHIP